MTLYFPESVNALGREAVLFLPALASPAAATLAEINGAGAVPLQCAFRMFNTTATQAKSKKYRACSKQGFDSLGRVERTIEAPVFIDNPQAEDDDPEYLHKSLVEGTRGLLLRRRGLDADPDGFVDWAVGQRYTSWPVEFGVRNDVAVNPEEDSQEFEYTQELAVIGEVLNGVVAA